jgi:hypothetical protein
MLDLRWSVSRRRDRWSGCHKPVSAVLQGWKTSQSNTEGWRCTTINSRSRPIPVSTLGCGNGSRLPSPCRR